MIDLKEKQKEAYQNKIEKGFSVDNVEREFCFLYGEVAEAFEAYLKKKDDLEEELADIVVFTLGISEILGIDLEDAVIKKMAKNRKRIYKKNAKGVLEKVGE